MTKKTRPMKAEKTVESLLAVLRTYGKHWGRCEVNGFPAVFEDRTDARERFCTCGWAKVRKQIGI